MTYPYSSSSTPALTDESTLEVAVDCLLEHLPITMEGAYTPEDLFAIMFRAASRGDSIEHTIKRLEGAPCGNTIRHHLDKWSDMKTLEKQVNNALQSHLPDKIKKKAINSPLTSI